MESTIKTAILDTSWVEEFEKIDKQYESFYLEDTSYVSIRCIYVNHENSIQMMKEEKFFMQEPNRISRDELLGILKKHCFLNNKRYSLLFILKYNFHLDPTEVKNFLRSAERPSYLYTVQNIDAIPFEKTIAMFQDLNDILIFFYEKPASNRQDSSSQNKTKRVIFSLHQKHKKTLRKMA